MKNKMKAIIWDGRNYPEGMYFGEFGIPKPEPGWVLIYVKACGICGSDVHAFMGHTRYLMPDENFPTVLGHENSGVIVEVSDGVTGLKTGDRVAVEPLHSCIDFGMSCPMCLSGKPVFCQNNKPNQTLIGMPLGRRYLGGYGEYIVANARHVFKIADNVSFEEAAMADCFGVSLHGVERSRVRLGDTAAVVGCGIIGLCTIQCLKAKGINNIIGVARYDFQAEYAKKYGAAHTVMLDDGNDPVKEVMKMTDGWGVNYSFECVGGNTDAVAQSIHMCCPGGKAVMLGGASKPRPIDLQGMILKESDLLSSMVYTSQEYEVTLGLMRDKLIDMEGLITHRFHPEHFREAIDLNLNKNNSKMIKAMFVRS